MILEVAEVSKSYGALRPLRLQRLALAADERVAIVGLEQGAAEILINLLTGATLPDQGEIRLFGRATADIADSSDWLATVDRFGIVSDRAVLLDQLSVVQNLAMPFTLNVEPPPADVRAQAESLAREVGIPSASLDMTIAAVDDAVRARVRLGRALALGPQVLLLEHATATLTRETAKMFGRDVRAIAARRGIAVLALTADDAFAREVAGTVLVHNPATGGLTEKRRGWFR
jgi:ABC-type polar amino acid transport system ATPase subunit